MQLLNFGHKDYVSKEKVCYIINNNILSTEFLVYARYYNKRLTSILFKPQWDYEIDVHHLLDTETETQNLSS